MTNRFTRRAFLARSGAIGAGTLLAGAFGSSAVGDETRTDSPREGRKKMPGVGEIESWYVPRITAVSPTGRTVQLNGGQTVELSLEVEPYQSLPAEQAWQRRTRPVLSATLTEQDWSKVIHYKPCVRRADGLFKMWYTGSSSGVRGSKASQFGYATSEDGIHWTEHPDNPVIRREQLPWGRVFHTPWVLYDLQDRVYKMWFGAITTWEMDAQSRAKEVTCQVGYGESPDGVTWTFHPEPITRSAMAPCVLKLDDGSYAMWANVRPKGDPNPGSATGHIYRLRSSDGIAWEEEGVAVTPTGIYVSCPYAFVMRDRGEWALWHAAHYSDREAGWFDITFCRSGDGYAWTCQSDGPVFPASDDRTAFDGRYTSTPFVLRLPGKYVLYYTARDMEDEWVGPDGSRGTDGAGLYRHIGYAEMPAEEHEDPTLKFSWSVDGEPAGGVAGSFIFTGEDASRHAVKCRVENANGSTEYTWDIEVRG